MIVLGNHINCREFSEVRNVSVASENQKTFRLINKSSYKVEKWRIDKCIFTNETTCDFLFLLHPDQKQKSAYWVELKSSDIGHAAFQILSTIYKIGLTNNFIHHARIIPSRNPNPKYRGTHYRNLENFIRAKGGTLRNQNKLLEETI